MGQFVTALRYPFIRFKRFWNFFWVFLPIIGPFMFYGYLIAVIRSIYAGKESEGLPLFWQQKFGDILLQGVFVWLGTLIVTVVLYALIFIFGIFGVVISAVLPSPLVLLVLVSIAFIIFFILALGSSMLMFQYADTLQFKDALNVFKSFRTVFGNFGSFILVFIRVLGVFVLSMLLVAIVAVPLGFVSPIAAMIVFYLYFLLVALPFLSFSGTYLYARFYRDKVLGKNKGLRKKRR